MDKFSLIFKLLMLSTLLSIAIKYLAPSLQIPTTHFNALIAILLPSLIMAALLTWQGRSAKESIEKDIN
jgi:hypothetical protein